MKAKNINLSYFLLIIAIVSVSTAAIFTRLILAEATPIVIACYRMIFSAIISWLIVFVGKKKPPLDLKSGEIGLLVLSGFFLALHFSLWFSSLEYTSVGISVVLVTTTPFWVALISPFLLKQKVPLRFYLGLLIAFVGGITIAAGEVCKLQNSRLFCDISSSIQGARSLWGMCLALLGAFTISGYFIIGTKLKDLMDTFLYTSWVYSIAGIFLFVYALLKKQNMGPFSPSTWIVLGAMALVPQTLGHSMFNYSLRKLPATTVTIALLGEPIGSTLLALFILSEVPSATQLIGGVIILIGIGFATLNKRRSVNVV